MSYSANLHSLAGSAGLGVECLDCHRRAHLTPEALNAHRGDMTEVRSLNFVCTGCKGRKVKLAVMLTPGTAGLWLVGQDVGRETPHDSTRVPYVKPPFREA